MAWSMQLLEGDGTSPSGTLLALILSTGVLYAAYRKKKSLEEKKPFEALPMPPKSNWLVGHIFYLSAPFQEVYRNLYEKHANKFGQTGFWFFSQRVISLLDTDDARNALMSSNERSLLPVFRKHVQGVFGKKNILVLNGKEWKFHRLCIQRALSPSALSNARIAIHQVVGTFVSSIKERVSEMNASSTDNQLLDMEPLVKLITFDVFCKVAISKDMACCQELKTTPVGTAFLFLIDSLSDRLWNTYKPWKLFYSIPTAENKEFARQRRVLRDYVSGMIEERRRLSQDMASSSVEVPVDFLTDILETFEGGDAVAQEDAEPAETLTDMLVAILFAGFDTTAIALVYSLYHVAHPDVDKECYEEISRVWKGDQTDPNDLVYCNAVLLETIRLFPSALLTTRTLTKDVELKGGVLASKGSYIITPIYTIQRQEKYFPLPNSFLPERWAYKDKNGIWKERVADEEGKNGGEVDSNRTSEIPAGRKDALFAFSAGARSCPGQRFAMMEAVLVIAGLLKNIKFKRDESYELLPIRQGIVQRPKYGMPMKLEFRD